MSEAKRAVAHDRGQQSGNQPRVFGQAWQEPKIGERLANLALAEGTPKSGNESPARRVWSCHESLESAAVTVVSGS
jgi:hypothetical protein